MLCCALKILYLHHNYTLSIETAIKKQKIISRYFQIYYSPVLEHLLNAPCSMQNLSSPCKPFLL